MHSAIETPTLAQCIASAQGGAPQAIAAKTFGGDSRGDPLKPARLLKFVVVLGALELSLASCQMTMHPSELLRSLLEESQTPEGALEASWKP